MMLGRGKATRSGFSLIEVLVAAVVLAGSLGVIFQALGVGRRGTARIEDEIQATNIGQDLIDFVASLPCSHLQGMVEDRPFLELPPASLLKSLPPTTPRSLLETVRDKVQGLDIPPAFSVLLTIEELAKRPGVGVLKKLTVKVTWTHDFGQGQQQIRDIQLCTLVSPDRELDL